MKIAGAIFGLLILAVVFVVWLRAYRSIKGDDSPLFSIDTPKTKEKNNSLDEFIASYKRGEVALESNAPMLVNAVAKPSASSPPAPPAAPATAPTIATKRDAFVFGSTKLAYLA